MNLTQLKYFQTACRLQSITRAAEQLHISQPSISEAIKDLEQEFGLPLVRRQYRGISVTAEGQQLLTLADSLLGQADQILQVMADIRTQRKTLRIGVPPMIGSLLLSRVMRDYFDQYTDAGVNIIEAGRGELTGMMASGSLDLAFIPHDEGMEKEYECIHVMNMETVCCVSLTHRLVNRRTMPIEELEGEPLVLFKDSFFQTRRVLERFALRQVEPRIRLYTSQLSTVERLVSGNLAVGFMFASIARPMRDVISIPLDPPMLSEVSLIWSRGGYQFREMTDFINYIKETDFETA